MGKPSVPSFAKEGWTRPKENAAKHPLIGADGVVVSSVRLIGGLKQLPRLRRLRNGAFFFMAQPPLCAEHVQQLGSENLLSNLMEVKD